MTRFRIKVARHWTTTPIILKDKWQPAFLRSFATIDEACLAMDNIVRRDHGLPPRPPITRREIREAMATYARIDREAAASISADLEKAREMLDEIEGAKS